MSHDVGLHQTLPFTPSLEAEPIAEPNTNGELSASIRDVSTKTNEVQDGCILYNLLARPGRAGLRATRHIDPVANNFATRRERENDLPGFPVGGQPTTQIAGGMYDGVLGVLSAPEIVRTPNDNGH